MKHQQFEYTTVNGLRQEEVQKMSAINDIVKVIGERRPIGECLQSICNIIPKSYPYPKHVKARIIYGNTLFSSPGFSETTWFLSKQLNASGGTVVNIDVFFDDEYIKFGDKKILIKDNPHINNIASLVSGAIAQYELDKLAHDQLGRARELKSISRTTEILLKGVDLDESLQEICNFLPEACQYPQHAAARIIFGNNIFKSRQFEVSPWLMREEFDLLDSGKGAIEIFYLKELPQADEGPFLQEERILIANLAALISGTASKKALRQLLKENTERLKELRGINKTSVILKTGKSLEDSLIAICAIIPEAWQYPEFTVARISYGKHQFTSANFEETPWTQKQEFHTPDKKKGLIEVFYLKEFPNEFEGPFLKEERDLLNNLANLIAGRATKEVFNLLQANNRERLKELIAINQTSAIIAEGRPVEETLQKIVTIIPASWQYPAHTVATICFEEKCYYSSGFKKTAWVQKENFTTIDFKKGTIEVYYLKEFPHAYEGPFLKEERNLLINLAKLVSGYLNNLKGREIISSRNPSQKTGIRKPEEYRNSLIRNKNPMQLFFNQQALDKYIYLEMMKYKVKEILFVATLYDAFILENEDSFFARFMGEIYQYSLFSLPRITCVTSEEEALEILDTTHFDLVILMVGVDTHVPVNLSKEIKQKRPDLSIYMLLNKKSNIKHFEEMVALTASIDKLFVWNGHSQIFFAIVKSIEDGANAENDTRIGLVRIILLIEDSAQYYSKYLRMLYSIVFEQIQNLLPEVEKNELDKIAKMRSRPKILHARNYEEAMFIFNKYKEFMLCVISDVEFERDGNIDKTAGIKFIKYVRSQIKNLPIILQSSENSNARIAQSLKVSYVNKNSDSLLGDLKAFLINRIFFGDFIFRDKEGNVIAKAKSLREFEMLLHKVSDESLFLHARENEFSLWLMSRGEIELARHINPIKVSNFHSMADFRQYIINSISMYREEKKRGKSLDFDETSIIDEKNIVRLSPGSFGGKGRGLAFINSLINNIDYFFSTKEINIRVPITAIIGINEFEYFMEKNHMYDIIYKPGITYREIQEHFLKGYLSPGLIKKLEVFLEQIQKPIAIRSSSLSEDSITQTFAGVFDTYIIPNNQRSKKTRLEMLRHAIKLVYASVYSDSAKTYFGAIAHRIEDERMAVVLQELVGNQFGQYYYPHISGTAQSYNYYPVAYMKPEEGFATAAVGLGFYVVSGRKSFRFSQKYPKIDIFSKEDLIKSTQVDFLAVDLNKKNIDLLQEGEFAALQLLDISEAEKHGSITHCASVYNPENDRIESGLNSSGPRIINFADILKFNYIPLAQTIDIVLNTISEALGTPVEIEYAVDLKKTVNNLPSFYLLQIKPLVGVQMDEDFSFDEIDKDNALLFTETSLGNGNIKTIHDVIYIDTEHFDKMKTVDMAKEIDILNHEMIDQGKKYVLIGPGRWGTRDPFLGIPVNWSQISNAKVIIETSFANYPLDASLGSHFFHNVTSMSIGYFSVLDSSKTDFINWELLNQQALVNRTKHFKHVRFETPLEIIMNGKMRTSAILHKK
jgi:hypothetical protein